jgi:hypothetical protein
VPRARLKRAYFRRVMWDMGEGRAFATAEAPPGPRVAGVPRWRIRYVAGLFAQGAFRIIRRQPRAFEEALECILEAGTMWGQMKRAVREREGNKRPAAPSPVGRGRRRAAGSG